MGGERSLQVLSERLEVEATGPFDLTPLLTDMQRLIFEYQLNFSNDSDSLESYYANRPTEAPEAYHLDYAIRAIDVNPFLNLFFPNLYVGEKTEVEGRFRGGENYILTLLSRPDTLVFDDYRFGHSLLDVSTSKVFNQPDVLASIIVESEYQALPGFAPSQDLLFESVWFNQTLDFRGAVHQRSSESLAELEGQVELQADQTRISFLSSNLVVLNDAWDLNDGAELVITQDEISVKDLEFTQGKQRIAIVGTLSDSTDKSLDIDIESFKLSNLNPIMNDPIQGLMNATASIKDPYESFLIETTVSVQDFYLSDFLVGNIEAETKFDNKARRLDVTGDLYREGVRTIYIYGAYFPEDDRRLDMVATFNGANLTVMEPFFDATFSDIEGKASGTFRIRGSADFPLLEGTGTVEGGHARVNYLNTIYDFGGQIAFTENEIGFRNLEVRDENNNLAYLDGGIFHDGFKDFVFNLYGDFTNFQVMKTTAADNDYFYGTGVVTGSVEFLGSLSNLIISGNAITNRGTKFFIPIDYSTTAEQAEFIRFVNLSDTSQSAEVGLEAANLDLSDINLDFELDVTPDAYVELIFDLKAGDIIRGRGRGEIDLEIDSEGTFNMFGDLEIESGAYNFTLYNLINKEFEIVPGSTISWSGDPYEAQMDINASYTQLASLAPIVAGYSTLDPASVSQSNELSRKYPAQAQLFLNGDLLSPDIGFGVEVTDYPKTVNATLGEGASVPVDLEASISAFKQALRADEQELKRQVFSLIILKRFSDRQSFDITPGIGTQALGSSVSELLSNQLSYWITQVDENLEIDVDLNSLSPEALNTFQLRLSYSFLDGRLRVTRDGYILNEDENGNVGSDIATLIGDWSVEYLLTPDGKFRVKMYSRNNLNNGSNATLESYFGTTTTTGVSLAHTQSFNNVGELFEWARSKDKEEPNSPPSIPADTTKTTPVNDSTL